MQHLDPHYRGDTFVYSFTLQGGAVGADYTGGVFFTVRSSEPASTVDDDSDAGVIAQVSVAGGGIIFSGATGTVTIADSVTQPWPTGRVYCDLQGKVTGGNKKTLAKLTFMVLADITRS